MSSLNLCTDPSYAGYELEANKLGTSDKQGVNQRILLSSSLLNNHVHDFPALSSCYSRLGMFVLYIEDEMRCMEEKWASNYQLLLEGCSLWALQINLMKTAHYFPSRSPTSKAQQDKVAQQRNGD